MASEVTISNMALSHLGQVETVVSLSPPNDVNAGRCARFYASARDEMLEAFNWSFAAKRATLANVTLDTTAWGFKFAMPSDCLKARKLLPYGATDDSTGIQYLIEGDFLYCNNENPTLLYTKRVTDTTKFTPMFTSSVSYRLSSFIAGPIVKKMDVVQKMLQMAMSIGASGASLNANTTDQENSDFIPEALASRGMVRDNCGPWNR